MVAGAAEVMLPVKFQMVGALAAVEEAASGAEAVAAAPVEVPPAEVTVTVAAEVVQVDVAAAAADADVGDFAAAPEVLDLSTLGDATDVLTEELQFVPSIRSGSFADIGPRRYMEDEHIRIDDLSSHLGVLLHCPVPSAFYSVFDGHGGPDAASYMKKNAIRLLFEEAEFPQASIADKAFIESVETAVRRTFLLADLALADDVSVSHSAGTTALAALIFGRLLLVANVGDCRAVLCRKGVAVDMSQDHRPIYEAEHQRVVDCGGFVDDGYLNGVLSVTRALGDWDIKMPPPGSASPLIADPEFQHATLTEDDEFLIIGCDGIWDVMTSQHAVGVVRRALRRHDDPERCARELVMEAKRLNTFDNLTVIVVSFLSEDQRRTAAAMGAAAAPAVFHGCKNLSAEAFCTLRTWLEGEEGDYLGS